MRERRRTDVESQETSVREVGVVGQKTRRGQVDFWGSLVFTESESMFASAVIKGNHVIKSGGIKRDAEPLREMEKVRLWRVVFV